MSYSDVNTPVIEQITLPSGNSYYIADREIRDVVDTLSQTIAGGVSFVIAWDGSSTPVVANIPYGVKVKYNNVEYTGTLSADSATAGAFYLVKSSTTPSGEAKDVYDEYVPVGEAGSKSWEKIGDTQVDLSDVVTGVTLSKSTDTVIGTDATFTITQPTVALSAESSTATGRAQYIQSVDSSKKLSASASGAGVAWNSKDSVTAITGVSVTSQPTVALSSNNSTATGRVEVADGTTTSSSTNTDILKGISVSNGVLTISAATLDTTYLGASASGTTVAASSTDTVIGTDATFTVTQPSVTIAEGSTGDVTFVRGGTTKYMAAAASGANTAWNSKDSVTVLTNSTDVSVTKGA